MISENPGVCAAAAGARSAWLTNDLKQTAIAAATAYASAYVAGKIGGMELKTTQAAVLHGLSQGTISMAATGRFHMQSFAAGFFAGAAGHAVSQLSSTMYVDVFLAGSIGGISSHLAGGSFSDGFITAAMVRIFNDWQHQNNCRGFICTATPEEHKEAVALAEQEFQSRMQEILKAGHAGKGHNLTYKESMWWWKNANGATLTIDGRQLSVLDISGLTMASPFPHLDALKVNGQVQVNPENGRIYDGTYDFDRWQPIASDAKFLKKIGLIFRNILNEVAIWQHGPGKEFDIQYRYEDSDFE